ncbi:MAG: nitrate reductase subunit alpha, partial [Veillonella sp.]|nr:nitrate reductase subunit alpha [Veillonella sp.]
MSLLSQKFKFLRKKDVSQSGHQITEQGGREWENFYRDRWSYDKVVRTTHGVNCTGSCSWNIYVKNGVVAWENQATDYPDTPDDMPDYEPRGCPRGATFSWYLYSPLRVKYPYVRGELAELWREAKKNAPNALEAWKTIVENPEKSRKYKKARGLGGFVRSNWDEASEIVAASMLYTATKYGPDRNAGFSVIPAMSMLSYAGGTRFLNLMGGVPLSFYDWYADLPPASPQVWGDQTDTPESGDWYNAGYIMTWGSNVPLTRTPDAHFLTEVRYKGTKVVSVSPDYAESTTSSDAWLNVKAGTDAALAMAMGHVILKEYYLDKETPFFTDYVKEFTDMPFLIRVEEQNGYLQPGRFLNAKDLGKGGDHAEFKQVLIDENSKTLVIPNGTLGDRHGKPEKWNLKLENSETGAPISPQLSVYDQRENVAIVKLPYFGDTEHEGMIDRAIPTITVQTVDGPVQVTTVFDLLVANYGLDRGLGGEVATSYEDNVPYTPAWQEKITGVKADVAISTAREFADNSIKTKGRSMIIMGGGINHWYHADILYRTILNIILFTATEGRNGGGWAHYVGQEKLRPVEGWAGIMTANDWSKAPRLQNGTSFFYFATEQYRSDVMDLGERTSKLAKPRYRHPADYNVM